MRRLTLLVLGMAWLGAGAPVAHGQAPRPPATELVIVAGRAHGTYHAVAKDIETLLERVVPQEGLDLDVIPSRGALQNVLDVFEHESIDLGLTQLDTLAYLNAFGNDDEDARRLSDAIQVVLPLYEEEVHLLARPGIRGLADLAGKRVGIGEAGSGTMATALVLLRLGRVTPGQVLPMDSLRALALLRRGDIDALFTVVGSPSRLLAEQVVAEDGLALVPVRVPAVPGDDFVARLYRPATIAARTYGWQADAVETVAVRSAIIMTGTAHCDAIGALARIVHDHLGWLRQNGHEKWKSVTLDRAAILAEPRLSPCVARRLR
jgi:TRAP transporter TAXI family solute receptor